MAMATLYDFVFDAEQDLDGVEGASGITLHCQVCKALAERGTTPMHISVPAGNASVIREAVRNHTHIGDVSSRYGVAVVSGGASQVVVGARDVTQVQTGPRNLI